MLKAILYIRFKQAWRELKEMGFFHYLLILGMFVVTSLVLYNKLKTPETAWYISGALLFLLSMLHLNREDKNFIILISDRPTLVFFTEYLMLTLPYIFLLLLTRNFLIAPLLPTSLIIIATLKIPATTGKSKVLPLHKLLKDNFEWISGIRQNKIILIFLYALGLGCSYLPFLSLAICLGLLAIVVSFFTEGEPLQFLHLYKAGSGKFLFIKLKKQAKTFLIFICPILVSYTLFNPDLWYITLIFILVSSGVLCFCILSKYMFYKPNSIITGNNIMNSLAVGAVLIPFLLPVPLLMCYRNYKIAIRNLQIYLDAGN